MYKKRFVDLYLSNGFDRETAGYEIDFLTDILFDYKYKDFAGGKDLTREQIEKIEKIVKERTKTRRPVQQLAGMSFFFGRKFFVTPDTLIPRHDTEILVTETIKASKKYKAPEILDIGTGTGCIPITTISENPDCSFDAVDISEKALAVAKKNAELYGAARKIKFFQSDLFEKVTKKYDIIVSNPPYIPLKEKENLEIEVKNYDPASALFTKDEAGVEFYEKISSEARNYLNKGGFLLFEIGINQSENVCKILKNNGYKNIKTIQDLNNLDRVIISEI